jgi:hypothetical protein
VRAARQHEIFFSQKNRFDLGQSFPVMDKIIRAGQMAECQSVKQNEVWNNHNDQMDRLEKQITELRQLIRESKV